MLVGTGPPPAVAQMGGMGGEMGMHGGGVPPQTYPSLMAAPPADPAAREAALREAHRRMTSGLPLLSAGLDEATRALQAGDPQGMREAGERMAEGLNLYRSGLSTHLALGGGRRRPRPRSAGTAASSGCRPPRRRRWRWTAAASSGACPGST